MSQSNTNNSSLIDLTNSAFNNDSSTNDSSPPPTPDIQTQLIRNFNAYVNHLGYKQSQKTPVSRFDKLELQDPDLHYHPDRPGSPSSEDFPNTKLSDYEPLPRRSEHHQRFADRNYSRFGLEGFKEGCLEAWDTYDFHTEQKIIPPVRSETSTVNQNGRLKRRRSSTKMEESMDIDTPEPRYEQLGERYEDSLTVNTQFDNSIINLPHNIPLIPVFKNNLYGAYPSTKNSKSDGVSYLASDTSIHLLGRNHQILKTYEIKPHVTTYEDSIRSSFSDSPHSVNFVKSGVLFSKSQLPVLVCCCDDARTLIFDISQAENLKLIAEFTTEQSAWGCDFVDDVICVSDNSHRVTVFWLDEVHESGYVWTSQSIKLSENLPDLQIVEQDMERGYLKIIVISISGELAVLEFQRQRLAQLQTVNHKPHRSSDGLIRVQTGGQIAVNQKYTFKVSCQKRTEFNDMGWSVCKVSACDFVDVFNPEYLGTTAKTMPKEKEVYERSHILTNKMNHTLPNSLNLGKLPYVYDSQLGIASNFESSVALSQYYRPFEDDQKHIDFTLQEWDTEDLPTPRNHNLKKIQKAIAQQYDLGGSKVNTEDYYIVTTEGRVALMNASLSMLSFTGYLYDTAPLFSQVSEVLHFHNRLSIVKFIPCLSLVIVVSQVGLLTGFRLVNYRGVKSLREEFTLPGKIDKLEDYQRIVGCDWVKIAEGRVVVSVVFGEEGSVKTFELRDDLGKSGGLSMKDWI
ncbi:hypothetical protein WICPIJ_004206 [Wickerhamomyces pijperi]|uniref:Uncharacterized protein n=1 Tax=Wickerhamomyces pijperi TaxID=599730 RepID=A0A9P8TMZ6_WICPI|nr:hypothetical protein WICPIJ_004206 [Wickerhamomyces pijperi]